MGIQPWITLYHWDLPYALEAVGGWTNRNIINWFTDFVTLCVNRFGDRVKHWIVLNEPSVFTGAGYFLGMHAPCKKGLDNFLPSVHHAALCQGIGGNILKANKLFTGTTFSCSPIYSLTEEEKDNVAAKNIDVVLNRLFIEPLLGMGYPSRDLKLLQQLEKYIKPGDEAMLECKMDFIGIHNNSREVVRYTRFEPYLHTHIVKASKRNVYCTDTGSEVFPVGLYETIKRFSAYEEVKQILVMGSQAVFTDEVVDGKVYDEQRRHYISEHLKYVLQAKNEGCPVVGYFTQSFTDIFDRVEGHEKRSGLVYVDFETQRRIIKSSGHWYRSFLECHKEQIPHKIAI